MNSQNESTPMKNLVLYFQVHQPRRLKRFSFFDIGFSPDHFDDEYNQNIMERVAKKSYLPTNAMLLRLIKMYPDIRITFSISGVALDQMKQFAPEVLKSFQDLVATGSVELLGETDQHSLACLMPGDEFEIQVLDHTAKLHECFGVRPNVFRNTELIYNNDVARRVEALGFSGIFTDGIEQVLDDRSPHHLYQTPDKSMKIFLRNYRLSDDIAFRYEQQGYRLTIDQYMSWLNGIPAHEDLVTLAMDYETFGEHQKDNNIISFLETLLTRLAIDPNFRMLTPTEAISMLTAKEILDVPNHISWADNERDLSAWLGNDMQQDAFESMIKLEQLAKDVNDPALLERWRWLQTSDHFYYMSTKKDADGNVHAYFSPYSSPYEAFINYMNVLHDFEHQLKVFQQKVKAAPETAAIRTEAERRELHTPEWAMQIKPYDQP